MIQLINSWIGIVVGVLTGIGLLYGFYKWIRPNRRTAKVPGQVIIENGNLFGIYPTSERTQFTFSDRDSNPILLKKKKKIFFIRSETKQGLDIENNLRNYQSYSFMIFNLKTFEEDLLTDQKPYWDGLDMSFEILAPRSIKAHPNGESILCIIEKYATASELKSIDIKRGKIRELISCENFDFIKNGKYKGELLVSKSEIRDRGRDIYYHIVNWAGKSLHLFEGYDKYMEFRAKAV